MLTGRRGADRLIRMELSDPRIDKLVGLIRDSFRVRPNQDPIYVDIGGNLERVRSKQHQLIFGRRGSGKIRDSS